MEKIYASGLIGAVLGFLFGGPSLALVGGMIFAAAAIAIVGWGAMADVKKRNKETYDLEFDLSLGDIYKKLSVNLRFNKLKEVAFDKDGNIVISTSSNYYTISLIDSRTAKIYADYKFFKSFLTSGYIKKYIKLNEESIKLIPILLIHVRTKDND